MMSKSRLWGEWKPEFYGSGTTIVVQRSVPHKPHLYLYADATPDEDRSQRDRYEMCYQIADYMNGGEAPTWLNELDRISEAYSEALTGAKIFATGPCIDKDPPRLHWVQDESDEAVNDRARLMDVLFGVGVL